MAKTKLKKKVKKPTVRQVFGASLRKMTYAEMIDLAHEFKSCAEQVGGMEWSKDVGARPFAAMLNRWARNYA